MAVFPLGVGAEFEIVQNHLSLVVEFNAAIPAFQSGTAVSTTRAVNADGVNAPVGGLPVIDVVLIETLGLSMLRPLLIPGRAAIAPIAFAADRLR